MASCVAVLLLVYAGLFTVMAGDDCKGYYTSSYQYIESKSCYWQHCCGSCNNRYCCSSSYSKLSEYDQNRCVTNEKPTSPRAIVDNSPAIYASIAGGVGIFLLLTCLCCPCCCLYKMCHKPRPVVGSNVAVVMNTQCIQQQPVMPAGQFSGYQPVPTQPGYPPQPVPTAPGYHAQPVPTAPGYGAQPVQPGQYLGQPYAPGAPPPYHMAVSPGYPITQPAYDGGQAAYPMLAPPGVAHPLPETSTQPAYNPAYAPPTKTGY